MSSSPAARSPCVLLLASCLLAATGCARPTSSVPDAGRPPEPPPPACSTCAPSELCLRDRCVPRDCPFQRCGVLQACVDGACRDTSCVGISCPVESTCAAGQCHPYACEGGPDCPQGQVCYLGQCADASCLGVSCPEGTACIRGLCAPPACGDVPCPPGEACFEGACMEPACVGVLCPRQLGCFNGRCSDCPAGEWPSHVDGFCQPTADAGTPCLLGYECTGSACVDGACCGETCAAPCTECSTGTCAARAEGAEDARCNGYRCAAGGRCGTSCAGDAGCAPGAYCAEGACTPKLELGSPCSGSTECRSGTCVDGTCCSAACDRACETCTAEGAVGTCSPSPAGTGCRERSGTCDVAETCDGASRDCPSDGFAEEGLACNPLQEGAWSPCILGADCSGQGTRTRSVTRSACAGGTCEETASTESESCTASPLGSACGAPQVSPWSPCDWPSPCATTGTRTRTRTTQVCTASGCSGLQAVQEQESCTRTTDGLSCGTTALGAWGACGGFTSTCDERGTRTRTRTTWTCAGGACQAASSQETGACSRDTDGRSCGSVTYGSCTFTDMCYPVGCVQTTRRQCASGSCQASTTCVKDETRCKRATCPAGCPATRCTAWY